MGIGSLTLPMFYCVLRLLGCAMQSAPLNSFDEVINGDFHNKKIRLKCIIVGKTLVPYHVPKTVKVQCISSKCKCELKSETTFDIDAVDNKILTFIDEKKTALERLVKDAMEIGCPKIQVEVVTMQTIERIFITRATGQERTRKGGGSRTAYVVGSNLETNSIYELDGYTTTDPKTQHATHVFTNTKKVNNDIESFNLSTKKHNELNEFCVSNNVDAEGMLSKLIDLYERYAFNITNIYERDDLHLVVDMLFRSVISFKFDKEKVNKGWIDAMIIGDTRCGKGFVAEKLVEWFGLGEVVSGENCSFAGLVGGLQQLGKQWAITWGKIPLNDCGLLVIDETSGMVEDMWGKLSRVRSEGVAEITKIQTEIANARTRLLFICNAPNKTISHYPYGIQAVPDMIKAPEDIARFDYVLVVAHNEVEGKDINRPRTGKPLLYSQKLEQELILWCWSRKADEVKFMDESISSIYEISLKISETYDFSIPLIQVENIRFKLAKLAIAFAARFYSNSENGKNLVIKPVHVECAAIFFDVIYRKEQSGYYQYSKMKKSELNITAPEKLKEIETYFNSWDLQKAELLKCLLQNTYIDHNDISVHLGVRKELGIECVSNLLKAGCLHKKGNSYVKASEFTAYLKKRVLERRR